VVNRNNLSKKTIARITNFFELDSRYHENAPVVVVPSSTCKTNQTKGTIIGLLVISCCDQC
jgi:hypothetical protein